MRELIEKVSQEVKKELEKEFSGHDWWHVYRVWQMAKRIGKKEKANMPVVELAALLHDIADRKFHNNDDTVGPRVAAQMLTKHNVSAENIRHICAIITDMAFKGAKVKTSMKTLEGKVVQDADRLDAIGAIGIARAFAYGGYKKRPMHDPAQKPTLHRTKEEYYNAKGTSINHFYEKLLLLKATMNTKTAKAIAKNRHAFMEEYLKRFFAEWEGKD